MAKQRRKRRSPEDMIADLRVKISRVKQRIKARDFKSDSDVRVANQMFLMLERARLTTGDKQFRSMLDRSHKDLKGYLQEKGVTLPKLRGARPRRRSTGL